MAFSWETVVLASLIVAFAYVAFGLTGFGSTVIALPLLAQALPLKFAVPMLMLLDLVATFSFGARFRKGIRFDEFAWLVPFLLCGMALGLTVLIRAGERPLLAVLGAFVLAYAIYGFTRRGVAPRLARAWCAPIGIAGGAFSALFGTGGVLLAVYNAGRLPDTNQLRATNAAGVMFMSLVRVVLFGAAGLLAQDNLLLMAGCLVPAMFAGILVGSRLHTKLPAAAVVRALYGILVVSGSALLLRALV
jgi:uncharacterized protein